MDTPDSFMRLARLVPEAYATSYEYETRQTDRAAIRRIQEKRLRTLLNHAYQNVPAYRRSRARVSSDAPINDLLTEIPTVTRSELQESFEDYVDDNLDPDVAFLTYSSGTTGAPLATIHDTTEIMHITASVFRWRRAYCSSPEHRVAHLYSAGLSDEGGSSPGSRLRVDPQECLSIVSSFDILDEHSDLRKALTKQVAWYDPTIIRGHTSTLLRSTELPLVEPLESLCCVIATGDDLSEGSREVIANHYGVDVYNAYGLNEVPNIAQECLLMQGLHVDDDRVIVELIDRDSSPISANGIQGEIVVTSLLNYAMPIIRYRTGDMAQWDYSQCRCGRFLKRITNVRGRASRVILLPNGEQRHLRTLTSIIESYPIRLYQLQRVAPTKLRVLVVPAKQADASDAVLKTFRVRLADWTRTTGVPSAELQSALKQSLKSRLPESVQIEIRTVSAANLIQSNHKLISYVDLAG